MIGDKAKWSTLANAESGLLAACEGDEMIYETANDDGMDEALTALLRAVEKLGVERAGDAVMAYQDTPDEDAQDWSFVLLGMIRTALQMRENAEKFGCDARDVAWISLHYGGGREVIQAWAAPNGPDPVTMKRRLAELVGF